MQEASLNFKPVPLLVESRVIPVKAVEFCKFMLLGICLTMVSDRKDSHLSVKRKCKGQKTSDMYSAVIAPKRKGKNKCPVEERGKDDASKKEKKEKKTHSQSEAAEKR